MIEGRWRKLFAEGYEANREGIGVMPIQKWESIAFINKQLSRASLPQEKCLKGQPILLLSNHESPSRKKKQKAKINALTEQPFLLSMTVIVEGVMRLQEVSTKVVLRREVQSDMTRAHT